MKHEVIATNNSLRMSPRKVRLLIDLVRGMTVSEALVQLQFSHKTAARPVFKLLQSAIANAKQNFGMQEDGLIVKRAMVNGGAMQYRWSPRAFGRAAPIRRRTAHVTIVLEGEMGEKANKKELKAEKTEPVEKTEEVKEPKAKKKPVAKKKETKK